MFQYLLLFANNSDESWPYHSFRSYFTLSILPTLTHPRTYRQPLEYFVAIATSNAFARAQSPPISKSALDVDQRRSYWFPFDRFSSHRRDLLANLSRLLWKVRKLHVCPVNLLIANRSHGIYRVLQSGTVGSDFYLETIGDFERATRGCIFNVEYFVLNMYILYIIHVQYRIILCLILYIVWR